ncbi:uncharacterized protein LOC117024603 [Rhinolophus ferrumequinum]|uniref:uncharacterized protein LOC117024603 n=1 Tax=Rhinolophus ferrumequinum TaxID=59479 RepID=UPI00140F9E66|nr:uncharacterized protein LOC117024603 [Rhinolophus ferrumequinum]
MCLQGHAASVYLRNRNTIVLKSLLLFISFYQHISAQACSNVSYLKKKYTLNSYNYLLISLFLFTEIFLKELCIHKLSPLPNLPFALQTSPSGFCPHCSTKSALSKVPSNLHVTHPREHFRVLILLLRGSSENPSIAHGRKPNSTCGKANRLHFQPANRNPALFSCTQFFLQRANVKEKRIPTAQDPWQDSGTMEHWLKHNKGNTQLLIKRNWLFFFTHFVKLLVCADAAREERGWECRRETLDPCLKRIGKNAFSIFDIHNNISEQVINIKINNVVYIFFVLYLQNPDVFLHIHQVYLVRILGLKARNLHF